MQNDKAKFKYELGLLRDSDKANRDEANRLLKETTEIANILILTLTRGARAAQALVPHERLHCAKARNDFYILVCHFDFLSLIFDLFLVQINLNTKE